MIMVQDKEGLKTKFSEAQLSLFLVFYICYPYLLFVWDFFYVISKKCLYRLPKGFVTCDATGINFTKEVLFFTHNQIAQRFCWLLYAFLSMLLFVFKNLFLRRDFFMICSNIPLFYGRMPLNSFIKSCFKSIKLKIVVLRSHLNNTIFWVR